MTGEDPFFVRLRHIMTHGDAGVTVTVFFISPGKDKFMQVGSGEIPFTESRFQLTMKSLASCTMTLSIQNPKQLLEKMIGAYHAAFTEDDLEPCIRQLVLTPIREEISKKLGTQNMMAWNSQLMEMSRLIFPALQQELQRYGLDLHRFALTGIYVPDQEMERLRELERQYAEGKTRTDLELDHLQRVWRGNLDQRTIAEMLTGISANRGQTAENSGGGVAAMMMQTMLLSELLPELQRNWRRMMNDNHDGEDSSEGQPRPPSMPPRNR